MCGCVCGPSSSFVLGTVPLDRGTRLALARYTCSPSFLIQSDLCNIFLFFEQESYLRHELEGSDHRPISASFSLDVTRVFMDKLTQVCDMT